MPPALLNGHVYTIQNKASGTFCNIAGGNDADGTTIWGWADQSALISTFDQQWLVETTATPDVYTLRSVRGGTYMDLDSGGSGNGVIVHGWRQAGINQQWKIYLSEVAGYLRLVSVASGTCLDLDSGSSNNGTKIQGWEQIGMDDNQLWKFTRVSLDGRATDVILKADQHVEPGPQLNTYLADGTYIGIPDSVRDNIWASTGLNANQWRDSIFDCDDFAFVAKAAVAKWARDYIRVGKISILFGIVFARKSNGDGHAYNFHLTPTLDKIVWYEPQTGKPLPNPGYSAYFGIF